MRPGSQDPCSRGLFLPYQASIGAVSPDPHSIGINTFNDLLKITQPVGSVSKTTGSGTGQSQEFTWRTQSNGPQFTPLQSGSGRQPQDRGEGSARDAQKAPDTAPAQKEGEHSTGQLT